MRKKVLSHGPVHAVPTHLWKALLADAATRAKWEDTPLARNDWMCWVISVKRSETRKQHLERVCSELKEGMRRPCCWPGCPPVKGLPIRAMCFSTDLSHSSCLCVHTPLHRWCRDTLLAVAPFLSLQPCLPFFGFRITAVRTSTSFCRSFSWPLASG